MKSLLARRISKTATDAPIHPSSSFDPLPPYSFQSEIGGERPSETWFLFKYPPGLVFMRVRPGNFPGLRSRPQLRATLLILSLLLLQLVHRANAQTQIPSHGPSSPGQQQIVRDRQEVTELELGKPVEREIAGGQPHSYRIDLAAGQYVKVKIDQRGIDVVVRLFGPDGKAISEVDNESRTVGEEIVELVAGAGGVSKIEIVPKYKSLPAGRYEIRLVEVRAATASDRLLDEAHKLVTQSREFERTEKYDDALSLAE